MDLLVVVGLLSDSTRVRLLSLLSEAELTVSELERILQAPQSTVSRHLKRLLTAQLVVRRSQGTSAWFATASLNGSVQSIWSVINAEHKKSLHYQEDLTRLNAVVAARARSSSFFSDNAAQWDSLRKTLFGSTFLQSALLSLLPRELVIVDVGCGTGVALEKIAPFIAHAHGVDREQAMLDAAKRRLSHLPNTTLHCAKADDLPFDSGSLDAVFAILLLHHVADTPGLFSEFSRVVRRGGALIVVDMLAHDRTEFLQSMGHNHLGFDPTELNLIATNNRWGQQRLQALTPHPDASGPPLFLSTWNHT